MSERYYSNHSRSLPESSKQLLHRHHTYNFHYKPLRPLPVLQQLPAPVCAVVVGCVKLAQRLLWCNRYEQDNNYHEKYCNPNRYCNNTLKHYIDTSSYAMTTTVQLHRSYSFVTNDRNFEMMMMMMMMTTTMMMILTSSKQWLWPVNVFLSRRVMTYFPEAALSWAAHELFRPMNKCLAPDLDFDVWNTWYISCDW